MPSGVYIRTKPKTEKQLQACRKLGKLPRTVKQKERTQKQRECARELCRKLNKLPRTKAQREAARENIRKLHKLPRTEKQRETSRKNGLNAVFANDIVEHHNDLKHGALRPDDVSYITCSEHTKLHWKLRREELR